MVKVKLYDKDTTTFIGDLNDTIECKVTEERNGQFELSLVYPNQKQFSDRLIEGNIIQCNANDELLNQQFRIYKTRKLMNNKIDVMARHISFDLIYDFIESISIVNQPCNYVLNEIFRRSNFSKHYQGFSDIVNAQNYNMELANCLEAIGGKQGSVLDTFGTGAEILRDNTNIHVLNKRGHDNGVHITYSKNMTDITVEEDRSEMITRIFAYAKGKDDGGQEILIYAPNKYVDSPNINLYEHPYIRSIDFTDKFGENVQPTPDRIQYFAEKYFRDNNPDIPKINYKIGFIPLSKTTQGGPNDNIKLCDIVYVDDTRYNIQTQAKAIKTVFNVLLNRYDSIELGQPKSTLADLIGTGGGEQGPAGPPGPQGPPGADGEIGDFPDSLPNVPQLTLTLLGLESIQCDWTFENKVYYSYQLYASKVKDFIPTAFDLIHEGQTSSFLFAAKPDETWYFRVRAGNTHNKWTEFSSQMSISTVKIDASTFIKEATIGNALIGNISADKINAGKLFGQYIDARNLSVTDGNGKRTFDIDSFGNVNLDVTSLLINSKSVAQTEYVNSQITLVDNKINSEVNKVSQSGVSNLVPFSYFTDHYSVKKHWFLNGVTWFEHNEKIGIQNIYNADGNIISEGKKVSNRTVSLYTDLDVEANITAKVYLIGSRTDSLQYDWTLDAISYTKNESGGKKLEGIIIPNYVQTLFFQISNLGEGTSTNNVVWINKINLVDGYIAKSGDLFDIEQSAQLSIDADGIRTEVSKKVDNDKVISSINQSAEAITINAEKVNLAGYATFSSLASPGNTTIDGRNIKTGFIESIQIKSAHITGQTQAYFETGSILSSDGEANFKKFYGMPGGSFNVESEATFGSVVNAARFVSNGNYVPFSKSGYKWVVESLQGIGTETGDAMEFQMVGGTTFGVDLWYSDEKLKTEIKEIDKNKLNYINSNNKIGLELINSIKHYNFKYKSNLNNTIECGYIAQDLQKNNEQLVDGFKQSNGDVLLQPKISTIIPNLSLAIQQQQIEINELKEKNRILEEKINLILDSIKLVH